MTNTDRYIQISKWDDGRWLVNAIEGQNEFDGELFNTLKQAIRAVPGYAKVMQWKRDSYQLTIAE